MSIDQKKNSVLERYFSNAVEWYCVKYLYCITERSWLLLVIFLLSTCLLVNISNIYSLFPLKKDFIFTKYTGRYSDEFSIIKKLNKDNNHYESPQRSISTYLIRYYVQKYESYDYNNLTNQFSFVKNNSSRKVFLQFKESMDFNNNKSRIITYGKDIKRIVEIDSVEIMDNSTATVTFKVRFIEKNVLSTKIEFYKVLISFSLSNIKMNAAGITPLEFSIQDYKLL